MAADAEDARGFPPPSARTLERLGADDWAVLLRAARTALKEIDDALVTPRVQQLRATPPGRLAGGRSRRHLCQLLAEGGPLWLRTVAEVRADPSDTDGLLASLREDEAPAAAPEPTPERDRGPSEVEERLRERNRELVGERDEARRRAGGLEARLETERANLGEAREAIERLEQENRELREAIERADHDREATVERLRRHHESQVAELREELRDHRRREEERRQRRQRQEEAREAAQARAREEIQRYRSQPRSGARLATPGRPSRLPKGVSAGTREAVRALLDPGRRVLIDGYNVTKRQHEGLPLEQQRTWLVNQLESLVSRTGIRCTVVFDGDPTAAPLGGGGRQVRVVFTSGGTADDELVELVWGLPSDEPVVVVTDDRELGARLRELGADVVGTRPFLGVAT